MKRCTCLILILLLIVGAVSCSGDVRDPDQAVLDVGEDFDADGQSTDVDASTISDPEPPVSDLNTQPDEEHDNDDDGEDEDVSLEGEDRIPEFENIDPPFFGFIDAHADTITRAMLRDQNMFSNNLHVDFERLLEFDAPVQVFAIWLADRYVDNAFQRANLQIDFFESEVAKHSDIIEIALTLDDLIRNASNNKISAILSIEGAEPLEGKIENVDHFYNRGVRIMSLTWNRENELGFGQATGSEEGIKPFGAEVLQRMEELGIIVDVSHINEAGFWDIHNLTSRPYMASHSNTFTVTPHNRNLRDDQIRAMVDRGGIIGLVLYPLLLSQNDTATIVDIMAHIRHFLDLGAGGNLGLGGDLDGFRDMPTGLTCVRSFKILEREIAEAFDEGTSRRIMSQNFYDFFVRYSEGDAAARGVRG